MTDSIVFSQFNLMMVSLKKAFPQFLDPSRVKGLWQDMVELFSTDPGKITEANIQD